MQTIRIESAVPGDRFVARMGSVLMDRDLSAQDRLLLAGPLFWRAVNFADFWPEEFAPTLCGLLTRLVEQGGIHRTVRAMNEEQAEFLCDELSGFVDQFMQWLIRQPRD